MSSPDIVPRGKLDARVYPEFVQDIAHVAVGWRVRGIPYIITDTRVQ